MLLMSSFAPAYVTYSEGGASAHVLERLDDCYMSDDSETQVWEGTLAAGASVEVEWDWCSPDDIVMEAGYTWEGSFEALAVELEGKGTLRLEVIEQGSVSLPVQALSTKRGYVAFQGCATYHDRVALTGTAFGYTTVRVTNTGSRTARDLSMVTHVGTNHSGFLDAHCTFQFERAA